MEDIFYILSIILAIAWAFGYIGLGAGDEMHVLLGMAAVLTVYRYLFIKDYKI